MALTGLVVAFHVLASSAPEPELRSIRGGIDLLCPDDVLGGEVTLLTDPTRAWTVRFEIGSPAPAPKGEYERGETEVRWRASAGTITPKGDSGGLWKPSAESGVHAVSVEVRRWYEPLKAAGLGAEPRVCHVYEASRRFIQPMRQAIRPGKSLVLTPPGLERFVVGRFPDPGDPADLRASSTPQRITANPRTFTPPEYWYRVDDDTRHLKISRSYTLGEFDLNRAYLPDWPWPGYIALDPNIVLKLEKLADTMRAGGETVTKFELIYGFRSPYYNLTALEEDGNATLKSPWSLHMYGKAADIILDEDADGIIDDLNGDGEHTVEDARVIRNYVRQLDREYSRTGSPLLGGNGLYYHHDFWQREPQTPYIHIDVRGFARENGTPIEWGPQDTLDAKRQLPQKRAG